MRRGFHVMLTSGTDFGTSVAPRVSRPRLVVRNTSTGVAWWRCWPLAEPVVDGYLPERLLVARVHESRSDRMLPAVGLGAVEQRGSGMRGDEADTLRSPAGCAGVAAGMSSNWSCGSASVAATGTEVGICTWGIEPRARRGCGTPVEDRSAPSARSASAWASTLMSTLRYVARSNPSEARAR